VFRSSIVKVIFDIRPSELALINLIDENDNAICGTVENTITGELVAFFIHKVTQ
jgi:hypothetical protein